jgi:hypothetical protein
MTRTILIAASLALAAMLPAVPARAQAERTFVSAAGSDSNNCASVTTPCRHFANAYAVTAPNGEIDVLDPANYGSLTITGPVSIEGHGWASSAAVTGQAVITINANPGDKINIIGVVLDGIAIANTTGIQFNSGGTLTVRDSVIRNFSEDGIDFVPNTSNPSQFFVSNTLVSDNGGQGISISPSGSGTTNGVLNRVEMVHNAADGLNVTASSQTITVTVSDSVSVGNANGITGQFSGGVATVMVRNSTIANNISYGLQMASGVGGPCTGATGAITRVSRSTITGNATGWVNANCSALLSYGDNNIDGNTNVNSEPPNSLVYR